MAHGGAREGTGPKAAPAKRGRPFKPKTAEEKNVAFDQRAAEVLPELFETLVTIAKGYKVAAFEKPRKVATTEMQTATGVTLWVFTVPPDKAAAMYLVDRASGKAAVKSAEQTETELILEVNLSEEGDARSAAAGRPGEWMEM